MIDDIPVGNRRELVTDIDKFMSSEGGKHYQKQLKEEYEVCVAALLDQDINEHYTPLTREAFIGDIRRLKATISGLRVFRDELVASIKDHEEEEKNK